MGFLKKDSLRLGMRSVIVVILVSLFVFLWGRHRTVHVDLNLVTEIQGTEQGNHLDVTIYHDEEATDVAANLSTPMQPYQTVRYPVSLRPGTYYVRGIVSTASGKNHIVRQTILVPDNDATMTLYLREK